MWRKSYSFSTDRTRGLQKKEMIIILKWGIKNGMFLM